VYITLLTHAYIKSCDNLAYSFKDVHSQHPIFIHYPCSTVSKVIHAHYIKNVHLQTFAYYKMIQISLSNS